MTADKRSVSTDALETLGTVIGAGQKRDAIHIAVEPLEAAETLYPGQHVGIVDGKATAKAGKALGIVDPFLSGPVHEGQHLWLLVYPRQITSLRHVWSHPEFAEADFYSETVKADDDLRRRVETFASYICETHDSLIQAARGHIEHGDYINVGELEGLSLPDGFWEHYEQVTGEKVDADKRYPFFSCSC